MTASVSAMTFVAAHRHPFFGLLFLLILVILVVAAVMLIVRALHAGKQHPFSPPPGPVRPQGHVDPVLNELRMRYARGEISRDEYLQRASDLGYGPETTSFYPGPSGPPTTSSYPGSSGPPTTTPMSGGPPG